MMRPIRWMGRDPFLRASAFMSSLERNTSPQRYLASRLTHVPFVRDKTLAPGTSQPTRINLVLQ